MVLFQIIRYSVNTGQHLILYIAGERPSGEMGKHDCWDRRSDQHYQTEQTHNLMVNRTAAFAALFHVPFCTPL